MKFVVTVQSDRRAAERRPVVVGTVIDGEEVKPAVVLMDEVSTKGFRIVAAVPMQAGETLSIDLPAVGERAAVVVRQSGLRFGCAFVSPLTTEELDMIGEAGTAQHALRVERAKACWTPGVPELAA